MPAEGVLEANGPADPLPYYYRPVIGTMYRRRIASCLSLLHPPYDAVLEIGYGSGVLLPSLFRISRVVKGIDLESDPEQVNRSLAKLGLHAELLRGDVCSLPEQTKSVDLVVAMSVFEHIAEVDSALSAIHRVLRRGGELLVGMPRVDKTMSRLFDLIGFHGIDQHHVTSYQMFLAQAAKSFDLAGMCHMPSWLPACCGLYFGMWLKKR